MSDSPRPILEFYKRKRAELFSGELDSICDEMRSRQPPVGLRKISNRLGVDERTLRRRLIDRGLMEPSGWVDYRRKGKR